MRFEPFEHFNVLRDAERLANFRVDGLIMARLRCNHYLSLCSMRIVYSSSPE